MPERKTIFFIGFMGSGKSTAGKKLASLLGWTFIDIDRKIEEIAGKTIPQIFSQEGEEVFRKIESEVLKSIKTQEGIVVSTGGGTPCHGDNMDYMLGSGLTVYLKMTPEQLTCRLLESTAVRPLIKNVSDEELPGFIERVLSSREKWYSQADIIIEGINLDINRLLSMIKNQLSS
ncbi:MAG: AAA family ATPase [Bacteroidales bacterium]|jgi:shikimate kinase|nr:AAA family ATPase [Bacteroidales bacterium]